jgi:hypothetical protein
MARSEKAGKGRLFGVRLRASGTEKARKGRMNRVSAPDQPGSRGIYRGDASRGQQQRRPDALCGVTATSPVVRVALKPSRGETAQRTEIARKFLRDWTQQQVELERHASEGGRFPPPKKGRFPHGGATVACGGNVAETVRRAGAPRKTLAHRAKA